MKATNLHLRNFGLATLLVCALGCSKSSSDPQPANPSGGTDDNEISATVGTATFRALGTNDVDGTRVSTTTAGEAPARLVLRGRSNGNDITLSIGQFTGAATYQVLPSGPSVASYSEAVPGGPSYNSQHMPGTASVGQIVITSWDPATKRIQGTFSFSGRVRNTGGTYGATQQVTGGKIDVRNVFLY